jgi:acyl-CoA synthetase (NDP forming)
MVSEVHWDEAVEGARVLVTEALAYGSSGLDEAASKMLLAAYGIPVPAGALVGTEAEAAAAAKRLRGRLVLKAVGPDIQHKTDRGLVILGVTGDEAAAAAFCTLKDRAGTDFHAVLIEEMVSSSRELLVGMKRDPAFGPVLAFGLGGVLTEVLGDVALALIPLDEWVTAELPELTRARRLLDSFRGAPPVDRKALARVFQAVSKIAEDFPEISEIDINPLLIDEGRPVAVDALVVFGAETRPAAAPRRTPPNLRAVFSPSSVAIVGASDDTRKWGGSALKNLLDGGYEGTIYPVNPRGGTFFGIQAYASLGELPEPPDLVLMAVGGAQVKGVLEECGRRGARAAVVLAAGFSETGAEGARLEREIVETASAANITLIGPNCMGLMSNDRRLHGTGFVALHPPKGRLSFVSQSGSIGPGVVNACEQRGIGMDKFISVGNEAMVSAFDVLEYLGDDPSTQGIMMYLEGIEDGRHFFHTAKRVTAHKPVVVLRGGRTELGSKAAASHTAALAGSYAVFEAAARQAGVVTCGTTQELVELGSCLAYLPLPPGRRVAIVTNGGGPGVLCADEVALNGLQLAELPQELIDAVSDFLPSFWSKSNPMDLVAAGFGEPGRRVIELVARCQAVDAVISIASVGVPSTGEQRERSAGGMYTTFTREEEAYLRLVSQLMEETGKPIINVPDNQVMASEYVLGDRFAPVILPSPRAAAKVLSRMAWYAKYKRT